SLISFLMNTKAQHKKLSLSVISFSTLIMLPIIILTPLFVRKDFHTLLGEPGSFTFSMQELARFPMHAWITNIYMTIFSLCPYLNPIVFILLARSQSVVKKKYCNILLVWFFIPICFLIFLGKNFQIRYVLFCTAALLPFLAVGISEALRQIAKPIVTI